jgi:hypothetical protein
MTGADRQRPPSGRIARALLIALALSAAAAATWQVARVDAAAPDGNLAAAQTDAPPPGIAGLGPVPAPGAILRDRPMAGSPFRLLGADADQRGDAVRAARFYAIAARRDPRDVAARRWLFEHALANGDLARAVDHLDAVLRIAPDSGQPLLERLLRRLPEPRVRQALVRRLLLDPPWRPMLPDLLAAHGEAASTEALLAALAVAPLRPPELALRVSGLEAMGQPGAARAAWSAGLDARARAVDGRIFDAGFELGEGPEPYGWRLPSSAEVLVGLDDTHAAQGRSSLALVLTGRSVQFPGVSQELTLAAGSYRLQMQADVALLGSGRPFAWTIACRDGQAEFGRVALPLRTDGWQTLAWEFVVPPGCPLQTLRLVHEGRNLAERLLTGRLAIDALALARSPQ